MRKYEIYKIKAEYHTFIMGRERLLFDLLANEYNVREIEYLCDPLRTAEIGEIIQNRLGKGFQEIEMYDQEYKLTHPMKGDVYINVSPFRIEAYCLGSRMLDLDLFVALSSSTDRFFAIMDEQQECGWLKPIKYTERSILEQTI